MKDSLIKPLSSFGQAAGTHFYLAGFEFNAVICTAANLFRVAVLIVPLAYDAFEFQGYSQQRAFIATQAPLPHTIPSFWRMVWEQHSRTIVCLAQETEGGKVRILDFSGMVLFLVCSSW